MIEVIAKVVVVGWHYWEDAPERQVFLRFAHRHNFHIEARMKVLTLDREVECFDLADKVLQSLNQFKHPLGNQYLFEKRSCENIAQHILDWCNLNACTVLEDNQQGATVTA